MNSTSVADSTVDDEAGSVPGSLNSTAAVSTEHQVVKIPSWSDDQLRQDEEPDLWSRLTHIELETYVPRAAVPPTPVERESRPVPLRIEDGFSRSLVTNAVSRLAAILHAIVLSKASLARLPVNDVYLDADLDEENQSRQLVMVFRVQCTAAQALAFWNSLDYELDNWVAELSPRDREIVSAVLAMRFIWTPPGER